MKRRFAAIVLTLFAFTLISGTPFAGSDPSTEFQNILKELQSNKDSALPWEFVERAEKLLFGFIEKYPESAEAADAHFTLGRIYSSIRKHKEAVKQIETYLDADVERKPSHETIAHCFLATSHLALENFDAAEKLFSDLLESGELTEKRMIDMARSELARIGTLRKLKIGNPAIGFSAKSSDGKMITLDDFKGKVVLLDFWASWCAPCKKEMPNVKKVYGEFHEKGFEIIGVSLDDKEYKFKGYVEGQKMTWPQIFDGKGWMSEIGRMYAVNAIPATFLIDRKGKIRYKGMRGKELEEAVRALIEEK